MMMFDFFTDDSDIDWTKTVSELDDELNKKYNLDQNEIEFIKTHVQEMK
jgi:type II restriction enzyme